MAQLEAIMEEWRVFFALTYWRAEMQSGAR
jgi:hypothetical protein